MDCVRSAPVEISGLAEAGCELYHARGECVVAFAVNAVDEECVAVATSRGIREFKVRVGSLGSG